MTNKKINIDMDFLDEDEKVPSKKTEEPMGNGRDYEYLGEKKGILYTDDKKTDGFDGGKNWQKYANNSNQKTPQKSSGIDFGTIIWVGLGILFLIGLFSGGTNSSPSSSARSNSTLSTTDSTNNSKDEVIVGQYSCTSYYGNEAGKIEPSALIKSNIDRMERELSTLDKKMDGIQSKIDSYSLNEYSQSSIDGYNYMVNEFNSLMKTRKNTYSEYSNLLSTYNTKVDTYNSYLETNCTKRY